MQRTRPGSIVRLRRLSGERRRLLIQAAATLSAASAAVALLPFHRAIRFGCVIPREGVRLSAVDCVWAVQAAAKRLPWRTLCIEQGLAVQRLLRGSGVDAVLHYGARHTSDEGKLEAHVWVSVSGETIIGGEEAAGFREIASFP